MTAMSFNIFWLCFIAHCTLFCAVSSTNTEEKVDGLTLPLTSDISRHGSKGGSGGSGGGPCKSASDCKGKDQGCFTTKSPKGSDSACYPCDEGEQIQKKLGSDFSYSVDGCGASSTWLIVGIVAGLLVVAALIITVVVCFLLPSCPLAKRRNNRNGQYRQQPQQGGQGQYQYQGQQVQYGGQQGQYPGQQGQPGQAVPGNAYEQAQNEPNTE